MLSILRKRPHKGGAAPKREWCGGCCPAPAQEPPDRGGSCPAVGQEPLAGTARPRRFLPGRRAGTAAGRFEHRTGTAPLGRPAGTVCRSGGSCPGAAAGSRAARRSLRQEPPGSCRSWWRFEIENCKFPIPHYQLAADSSHDSPRTGCSPFQDRALGSRPAPGTPSAKRSVGTRRAASMQDTLSEGTARTRSARSWLAPSAVTASAVGGSATRSVVANSLRTDDERLLYGNTPRDRGRVLLDICGRTQL